MNKYSITRDRLAELGPCDLNERLALFGEATELNVAQALEAGASVGDILWVAGELGFGMKCAEFAIRCAESMVQYIPDMSARAVIVATIDAAKACVKDPTPENRAAAYDAYAAYAAADVDFFASRAARAAANAAANAARAAYVAGATDAAAYAAYVAGAAADAAYVAGAAAGAAAYAAQETWLIELFAD